MIPLWEHDNSRIGITCMVQSTAGHLRTLPHRQEFITSTVDRHIRDLNRAHRVKGSYPSWRNLHTLFQSSASSIVMYEYQARLLADARTAA